MTHTHMVLGKDMFVTKGEGGQLEMIPAYTNKMRSGHYPLALLPEVLQVLPQGTVVIVVTPPETQPVTSWADAPREPIFGLAA